MDILEQVGRVDKAIVRRLRERRKHIHHPFAHGSTQVWTQYFADFDGQRVGALLNERRVARLKDFASSLIQHAHDLNCVLSSIRDTLAAG
jgi:hypothetical protein